MALRQRQWVIYTRPYNKVGDQKIFYTGMPAADAGKVGERERAGTVKNLSILQPGISGVTKTGDDGGWVVSFRSYSISEVKQAYKELLKDLPSDFIRITEEIPFDTMITPIS